MNPCLGNQILLTLSLLFLHSGTDQRPVFCQSDFKITNAILLRPCQSSSKCPNSSWLRKQIWACSWSLRWALPYLNYFYPIRAASLAALKTRGFKSKSTQQLTKCNLYEPRLGYDNIYLSRKHQLSFLKGNCRFVSFYSLSVQGKFKHTSSSFTLFWKQMGTFLTFWALARDYEVNESSSLGMLTRLLISLFLEKGVACKGCLIDTISWYTLTVQLEQLMLIYQIMWQLIVFKPNCSLNFETLI